jgi:23S rRNA (cytidine1920-2'-O)/16S rRNA (cytidine1409-2'-O)-methyltransferase
MPKSRLDALLVARGLARDLKEASRLCLAGELLGEGCVLTKPGMEVSDDIRLTLRTKRAYVSRGGEKLAGALDDFGLSPAGLSCLDVGASTGGFTDCLLKRGARQVTAVDVAYGQFAWSLRSDPRVVLRERTNIRELTPDEAGAPFDLLLADLSFTTLASLLPRLRALIEPAGTLVALIKPQFELPASAVGPGGVVVDVEAQVRAVDCVLQAARECGLAPAGLAPSRLKGSKGNIEFFFWARFGAIPATITSEAVVRAAWAAWAAT